MTIKSPGRQQKKQMKIFIFPPSTLQLQLITLLRKVGRKKKRRSRTKHHIANASSPSPLHKSQLLLGENREKFERSSLSKPVGKERKNAIYPSQLPFKKTPRCLALDIHKAMKKKRFKLIYRRSNESMENPTTLHKCTLSIPAYVTDNYYRHTL